MGSWLEMCFGYTIEAMLMNSTPCLRLYPYMDCTSQHLNFDPKKLPCMHINNYVENKIKGIKILLLNKTDNYIIGFSN